MTPVKTVVKIDNKVKSLLQENKGDQHLLASMLDYSSHIKILIDTLEPKQLDEFLASFKSVLSHNKRSSHLVNYVFEQFKIKFYLKEKLEDFLNEAQMLIKQHI